MTLKTLEELNREFISENLEREPISDKPGRKPKSEKPNRRTVSAKTTKTRTSRKKIRSTLSVIYWMLFYVAILLVLFAVLTGSSYSFFTVTTAGATDEIPKGSLVVAHRKDPQELKAGDTITYMRDLNTVLIDEIRGIRENYPDSGSRGFVTKSANDINGEKEILLEENVIGKVVYTLPGIGTAISWLSDNITIVFIVFGLYIVLFLAFRMQKSKKQPIRRPG